MNNKLSSVLYNSLARLRNPSLSSIYKDFKNDETLSRDRLLDKQFQKLKSLLIFAGEHSPYYSRLFKDGGFEPELMKDFSDIKLIPISDKRILIDNNKSVHSLYKFNKTRTAVTSGTSGESLTFQRNEQWDSANRAGVMQGYSWHGVKVSDRNGYFWGYNLDSKASRKVNFLDAIQNRKRIFKYTDEEIKKFCSEIKDAVYLSGYSSMIYKVAQEVNRKDITFNNIKMIKGTSEMILPKYQEEVKNAFGLKMISEYGATETGLISFECAHGNQHVNTEGVFLETDSQGEVIVTNLYSYSFPIIRYKLGDIVELSDEQCTCGMNHPLIKDIVGRKGANVVGKNGEYPSFTFYYVFKNIALEDEIKINYKASQASVGNVLLEIEGNNSERLESIIRKHLGVYFGEDVAFEIVFVSNFDAQRKKMQSFVSYLEV